MRRPPLNVAADRCFGTVISVWLVVLLQELRCVRGWLDTGHMLVAEIARTHLRPEEVKKIDAILGTWSADFPGMSDLVGAAVWMDHIKCKRGTYPALCQGPLKNPALSAFDTWHYADLGYSPDGIIGADEHDIAALERAPSALWALQQAVTTLRESENRWSLNLMLRSLIHIVGDLHQPLHDAEGFFNDKRFGDLPHGDHGGNLVRISDPKFKILPNLHILWDAAAGLYLTEWPLSEEQADLLRRNASDLVNMYGRPVMSTHVGESCVTQGVDCLKLFADWAEESHQIAITTAYGPGVSAGGEPTEEYTARVREVCQRQITVAGLRLAGLLSMVAEGLPTAMDLSATPSRDYPGVLVAVCALQTAALLAIGAWVSAAVLRRRRARRASWAVDPLLDRAG
eukprot:CAMPEP_0176219034 /NCGR_PEP_ID=MMETSP0121_2-20121125/18503_1 /TAXON_ID=160619 /ORGANISM="Kryptoperidinium foliaceum, Strain CCMP 1326" /LENGTH=398 /DNA_ID=CAMNT_0017558189 /DNA_START=70 /DNA_END=1266 /DNA_ORIENTATION=+